MVYMGSIKKKAFECLPQFIKPFALKIYYTPIDLTGFLKDKSGRVLQPKRMTSLVGDGDLKKSGKIFCTRL